MVSIVAISGTVGFGRGSIIEHMHSDEQSAAAGVVDALLVALSAQVISVDPPTLSPGAVAALGGLYGREDVEWLFGSVGHLIHYDMPPGLDVLINLISDVHRSNAPTNAALRPGDQVRIVGEMPPSLEDCAEDWVRQSGWTVRHVGTDGRVLVQPELSQDYVLATVPEANLNLVVAPSG